MTRIKPAPRRTPCRYLGGAPEYAPSPRRRSITIELDEAAQAIGADLLVAGGFGHSRLGEWFFGGVTRELLHFPERFVLLSH